LDFFWTGSDPAKWTLENSPLFTWKVERELIHPPQFTLLNSGDDRAEEEGRGEGAGENGPGGVLWLCCWWRHNAVVDGGVMVERERCYYSYLLLYHSHILSFLFSFTLPFLFFLIPFWFLFLFLCYLFSFFFFFLFFLLFFSFSFVSLFLLFFFALFSIISTFFFSSSLASLSPLIFIKGEKGERELLPPSSHNVGVGWLG